MTIPIPITASFVALALVAAAGAIGVLVHSRTMYAVLSFLLCGLSMGGLFLLLNMPFLAAVHLVVQVCLTGMVLVLGASSLTEPQTQGGQGKDARLSVPARLTRHVAWGMGLGILLLLPMGWVIAHASVAEPVLSSLPMWVTPGGHIAALGDQWLDYYPVALALLGLLLLTGIVSAVCLLRPKKATSQTKGER